MMQRLQPLNHFGALSNEFHRYDTQDLKEKKILPASTGSQTRRDSHPSSGLIRSHSLISTCHTSFFLRITQRTLVIHFHSITVVINAMKPRDEQARAGIQNTNGI